MQETRQENEIDEKSKAKRDQLIKRKMSIKKDDIDDYINNRKKKNEHITQAFLQL